MKKMKSREVYALFNWISAITGLKDGKFAYALGRNKARIKTVLTPIEELPAKKAFVEYNNSLKEVDKEINNMLQDEKVKPEDREAKMKAFDKRKKEIEKKNEAVIKSHDDLLDMEIEFEPYMINKNDIPTDIEVVKAPMTRIELQDVMEGLIPIIKDE